MGISAQGSCGRRRGVDGSEVSGIPGFSNGGPRGRTRKRRSLSLKKILNQGVRSMREKRIKSLKLPEPDNLVPRVRGPGHRYIQEQTAELLAGSSGLGDVSPWDPRAGDGGRMSTHTSPSLGSSPAVSSWWARPGQARAQDCGKRVEARDGQEQPLGGPRMGQAGVRKDTGSGCHEDKVRCPVRVPHV